MSDIDNYIMKFGPEVQQRLIKIRILLRNIFGEVEERIYFGMPTVSVGGKDILHYAGYKNQVTLIVGYEWSALLKARYPQFRYTKATVSFAHKDPFPEDSIREIFMLLKQMLAGAAHTPNA